MEIDYLPGCLITLFDELLTETEKESLAPIEKYNALFDKIYEGVNEDDLYEQQFAIGDTAKKSINSASDLI